MEFSRFLHDLDMEGRQVFRVVDQGVPAGCAVVGPDHVRDVVSEELSMNLDRVVVSHPPIEPIRGENGVRLIR
ncbi:hypothetical protein CA951_01120 [Rhodococcus sp. NCIMB 12038]|nr:hypothetical protein CA951_01120 [Rhodococcus sp. NCIMB 12038]